MKFYPINRQKRKYCFLLSMLLWILLAAACSGSQGEDNTGKLAFKAVFPTQESANAFPGAAGEIDVCSELGIQTITAKVIDADGNTRGEGSWPCDIENHRGTINQIQSGTGYRVVVEGIIDESVQYRGEKPNIIVTAGETTDAGIVEMTLVGQYQIVASAGTGGTIDPSGTINVERGATQIFTITPGTGYMIFDVEVDRTSIGPVDTYTFSDVGASHTINAIFTPITFTVTASADEGGRIEPSGERTVNFGGSLSLDITADPGYYLSAVLVNGSAVAPQAPYIIDNITADTTVHAMFSAVVFVDAGAPDGGDGSSWLNAFNQLQAAINIAADGEDIWVKSGTYTLSSQVSVNKAVNIYGGFVGDEILLTARDAAANQTLIDGDLTTRCFFINEDATLDGLVIQNGRHIGDIYCQGGGIYIDNASPRLVNCLFYNNALIPGSGPAGRGGAIYIDAGAPIMDNCHFENNLTANYAQPSEGGAIFNNGGSPSIRNSAFINNRAPGDESSAGAIYNSGGISTITGCRFADNYAGLSSGGLGGAIFNGGGRHTIADSLFQANLAEGLSMARGGAIYNSSAVLAVTNTIFLDNEARHSRSGYGGAMYNANSDPFITNCTFFANRAVGTDTPYAIGGAIYNDDSRPTIVNSILWGNNADQGLAIFDEGTSLTGVNYCDIDQSGFGGSGNIDTDPLLDAQGRLRPGSPCIDAGDTAAAPETDIDGEMRPVGIDSDIGADEFVDSDDDGMPDYWERMFGLDAGVDDSGADLDSDGATNGFEYRFDLDPSQANPVIDAAERGSYDQNGNHNEDDDSTPTGLLADIRHRSYFIFPLNEIADTVVAAVLRLEVVTYTSTLTSDDLMLYDVSTDPATLELSSTGETAIFNDLGSGDLYAERPVGPGDVGLIIEIPLSDNAIADINAMRGGHFPVGLMLEIFGVVSTEYVIFSDGTETRVHQLVLKTQ